MSDTLEKAAGNSPDQPFNQWTESHGAYTRSGRSHDRLPPGIYDIAITQEGIFFVPVMPRVGALLRFEEAVIDEVITEVETFWGREETFRRYDMSFRRGILLYGPPGSGKSCTLQLIATDVVDRGGIVLLWNTSPENFLAAYREFRRVQPDTEVVVFMEDLDAMFDTYKSRESMILNILDGVERMDRLIYVATTNYIEALGERVRNRPSRFDRLFFVDVPNDETRRVYLQSLLKGEEDFDIDAAVRGSQGWSLAHLKELFTAVVIMGTPYRAAYDRIQEMFEKKHSAEMSLVDQERVGRAYI